MGGKGSGRRRAIPIEREHEVVEQYEHGRTVGMLMESFGVSDSTIRTILHKHGCAMRNGSHKHIDAGKVCEMYQGGMRVADIARELGCAFQSVTYWLEKSGMYDMEAKHRAAAARDADIVECYNSGMTNKQIGELLGVCPQLASKVAKRNGCAMRGRNNGTGIPRTEVCPNCGKQFTTSIRKKVFCSRRCGKEAATSRRADRRRTHSRANIPLRDVYKRDGGKCYLCGATTDWNDYRIKDGHKVVGLRYPTRDHVIALHNGGAHTWENIRLACFSCNSKKRDKSLREYVSTVQKEAVRG